MSVTPYPFPEVKTVMPCGKCGKKKTKAKGKKVVKKKVVKKKKKR